MAEKSAHPLDHFLQQRMRDGNIRSTALLITFFCDVVTQHGGEIWLGSIIHALSPLGINERLTRTSVFRLVQDGWLEARKQGRRSYYRLTQTGQNYYQRAANRIYASQPVEWNGNWTLLLTSMTPEKQRDALNRGLLWLGYGRISAGVYALPGDQRRALDQLLSDLQVKDKVINKQAHTDDVESLQELVLSRWNLDELSQRYKSFTQQYRTALKSLKSSRPANGHSLLLLKVLLIHEYRRILLSDPELPAAMLPKSWDGHIAQALTAEIYRQVTTTSSQWVNRELINADGLLLGGHGILKTRFSD